MNVMSGRIALVAVLGLCLSSASMAREAAHSSHGPKAHGMNGRTVGFTEPAFAAPMRAGGKEGPYTWPVGDRYHPVSTPFYGRAY